MEEVAAIQANIDVDARTKAIGVVESAVRSGGKLWVDSIKVQLNKAAK